MPLDKQKDIRGSQYRSQEFQYALRDWGMRPSMSSNGNCWDSSATKIIWSRLKSAGLYGRKFTNRREAMEAVQDWMAFYNYSRLHSTLGYVSPMQNEQRWHAAQRKRLHNLWAKRYTTQGQGQSSHERNQRSATEQKRELSNCRVWPSRMTALG